MVSFQDVSFGYPGGPTLFRNLDFGLDMESRLAIVGANGEPLFSPLVLLATSEPVQLSSDAHCIWGCFHGGRLGLNLIGRFAGIGKSTLLNLISGILEPTVGHITRNPKVRMATFSQHHVDGLDLALTPIQAMLKAFPNTKEQEMRCGTLDTTPYSHRSERVDLMFVKVEWWKPS